MLILESEIPKHRKKSNKTIKKTKHKHTYETCLIYDVKSTYYFKGSYCTICGKIGNWGMETEQSNIGGSRMLSQEELREKYKDCKIKEVSNISKTKSVSI